MAFYLNKNTDDPEILINGGSLKIGEGLNISDDELVAIGGISKDELNTILQNYLSLDGGTLTDGVTITPEGITINNQFTSWNDILNVSKGDSTKYLTEHQKLKTLNGTSLVGEGNIEITIPEVDLSEIQTLIDANKNSISSHTSSILRLESNINGALASIETKANKSDLDNYVSTEAFANFQSDYDSAQSLLGTRLTSIEENVQRNTSSIATLTSNLESANANISTNAGKITNLTNELGVVNGKVETNSQSILDLNSEIDNAQATLAAHTSSISTLDDKISGLESTISTNSQSILQLTTDLQQANADIQTTHSEITGLQDSIDGKLNTSDFWTTLGYNSEEEFKQAISENGLTQEQIDALRNLTDGEYLSTDSFLELISDEDFASSEIGSKLLEVTKNNVDDQTIIDIVTSESTLSTLATAVGASSELTNKYATIQSVEDLSNDLATETTNRTEAISSLQQTVNDKISSAELLTSLENYYDKSTVDDIIESAKTEARSGLLLESDLDSAIADLGTYYTKSEVDGAISESSAGFVAQSDYDTAQANMSSRIDDVEASVATAVTKDSDGNIESNVTISADQIVLNGKTWADIIDFEELISELWLPNDEYPTEGMTIGRDQIYMYYTDGGDTSVRTYTDIKPGYLRLSDMDSNDFILFNQNGAVDFNINNYFNVQSRGVNMSTPAGENITLSTDIVDVTGNIKATENIEATGNIKAGGDIEATGNIKATGNITTLDHTILGYSLKGEELNVSDAVITNLDIEGSIKTYGDIKIYDYDDPQSGIFSKLTCSSENELTVSNSVVAPSFKNSNSSDSEVLLGGGGTKALSDFVTLDGQGEAYTGTINGAKFINGVCVGPA